MHIESYIIQQTVKITFLYLWHCIFIRYLLYCK